MSLLYAVNALQVRVGNPTSKLLLVKLGDQANDNGECRASYQSLAAACEMDKKSVISHIKKLEELGFIEVERNKNEPNLYILKGLGGEQ